MQLKITQSMSMSSDSELWDSQTEEVYWARLSPSRREDKRYGDFQLKDDKVYVGRDSEQCEVCFTDPRPPGDETHLPLDAVSRRHLRIERQPAAQCAKVTNLSSGRTWVGGNRLHSSKTMFAEDLTEIVIGIIRDADGNKRSGVKYKIKFETGKAVSVLKKGEYMLQETKQLGAGRFGQVFAGEHVSDGRVAIKRIDKKRWRKAAFGSVPMSALNREGEIMKKLKHENIVEVFDVLDTDECVYIVMRFAAGGTLQNRLGDWRRVSAANPPKTLISADNCRDILWQLIDALRYMHSKGIAHRDLKPENILFKDESYHILIVDFGLAKMLDVENSEYLQTTCGSTPFGAPEVFHSGRHGLGVDYWSLGVVLYIMLAGHSPYYSRDLVATVTRRRKFRVRFPKETWTEKRLAYQLLKGLLNTDPKTRFGYEQVAADEWMNAGPRHRLNELCAASTEVSATIGKSIGKLELSPLPRTKPTKRKARKRRRVEIECNGSEKENATPNKWEHAAFERPKKKQKTFS